jgi:hypothetical protein
VGTQSNKSNSLQRVGQPSTAFGVPTLATRADETPTDGTVNTPKCRRCEDHDVTGLFLGMLRSRCSMCESLR